MERINLKITYANCWRMVGFYGCVLFCGFLMVCFIWMFFMPLREDASVADFWGVKYLQFLCLVAAVAYGFLAKKNNQKAQLLDKVVVARQAYLYSEGSEKEKEMLWQEYCRLSAEAEANS